MVIRYAMLVALAAASVWALFDVSANQAPMLLVDAGHTGSGPTAAQGTVAFWLLAAIAILITLSLFRFVLFGLPSMVDGFVQERKNWIFTLVGGGLLYAVIYLM